MTRGRAAEAFSAPGLDLSHYCFLLGVVRHAALAVAITGPRDERKHAARRAEGPSDALPVLPCLTLMLQKETDTTVTTL